jgi:hypothetical protein
MINAIAGLLAALLVFFAPPKVTFSETIAPIVYENCVTCHRPGEAAPFSLITYDDVRKRGATIVAVTKSRYMPPWHAAAGYGEFRDERRLTDAQIQAFADWVSEGMPEGDPSHMPVLPKFPDGWHLGKPDLILEMPAGYDLPADGPDIFRDFVVPTNLTEDKWVRAIEFRPSARKVVHHVLFAYDAGGAFRKQDGADGKPGFAGQMAPIGGGPNTGGIGGWAVGATPSFLPEGTAIRLPKGSDFILQMHFHLTGKAETERSRIGIYFADKPPDKMLIGASLPALFGFGAGINIPAGKRDYTISDSLVLPVDVEAFGIAAHAHYIAKEMKADAMLPDGRVQPLIWIKNWDFNWQDTYTFKTSIRLPKDTRIDVHVIYDNSTDNPRNPNNPPKAVFWGEQSSDEMARVGILMVAERKEDESILDKLLGDRERAAIQEGVRDGTLKRMMDARQQSQAR